MTGQGFLWLSSGGNSTLVAWNRAGILRFGVNFRIFSPKSSPDPLAELSTVYDLGAHFTFSFNSHDLLIGQDRP
jgi:myo-inositol-hexaphosphate 3-phosphohydrolase